MRDSWGRFTVRGTKEVEELITSQMEIAEKRCREALDTFPVEAILLLGGYGRGEGGVEIVDGVEKPHNNFDFLVITKPMSKYRTQQLKDTSRELFDNLAQELGIGIDFATSTDRKLAYSPCLVMWYDMRFGHKVITGPDSYMERFSHFRAENIVVSDAMALLVNRGTLFVINQVMLAQNHQLDASMRRWFTKHMIKAIIGYGDALLYFLGDYNWSYQEKGRRMEKRTDVNEEFKKIYLDALDFRFAPRYAEYENKDPLRWLDETLRLCEQVHLECERIRLKDEKLVWETHLSPLLRSSLSDNLFSVRSWARKMINSLKVPRLEVDGVSLIDRIGYRAGGPRGILMAAFPAVVYSRIDESVKEKAAKFLQSSTLNKQELAECYLRWWAKAGDTNFLRGLRKMGISIDSKENSNDMHYRGCPSHVPANR
jgi:hypothetical protein